METTIVLVPEIKYPNENSRVQYAHIEISFAKWDGEKLEKMSWYAWNEDRKYGRLQISCQIDGEVRDYAADSYAWRIGYDSINLIEFDHVELMYKTLKPIVERYEKKIQQYDWLQPQTFGQYVQLIAEAAKIKYMVIPQLDNEYALVKNCVRWLDEQVFELRELCLERQAVRTA